MDKIFKMPIPEGVEFVAQLQLDPARLNILVLFSDDVDAEAVSRMRDFLREKNQLDLVTMVLPVDAGLATVDLHSLERFHAEIGKLIERRRLA